MIRQRREHRLRRRRRGIELASGSRATTPAGSRRASPRSSSPRPAASSRSSAWSANSAGRTCGGGHTALPETDRGRGRGFERLIGFEVTSHDPPWSRFGQSWQAACGIDGTIIRAGRCAAMTARQSPSSVGAIGNRDRGEQKLSAGSRTVPAMVLDGLELGRTRGPEAALWRDERPFACGDFLASIALDHRPDRSTIDSRSSACRTAEPVVA